jgi:hypothetical protein
MGGSDDGTPSLLFNLVLWLGDYHARAVHENQPTAKIHFD